MLVVSVLTVKVNLWRSSL